MLAHIERDLSNATYQQFVSAKDRGLIPADVFKDKATGFVQLTDEQYEALVLLQNPLLTSEDSLHVTKVDDDFELPPQTFRGAWRWDGKEVTHDWKAAVEIQLLDFRIERDKLLQKYDGLQIRATDLNDSKSLAEIAEKKTELRDSTDVLKNLEPTSIEDILNATPDLSGY